MTKSEFLEALDKSLKALRDEERKETVSYYSELIADRVENGMTEDEAIAELGSVEDIARQIIGDAAEKEPPKPKKKALNTTLLIIGSPVWLALLIAAAAVLIALYACVWSILVAVYAVEFSFAVTALASVVGTAVLVWSTPVPAFSLLGCGLVLASLALFLFVPMIALTKLVVRLSAAVPRKIIRIFSRKG